MSALFLCVSVGICEAFLGLSNPKRVADIAENVGAEQLFELNNKLEKGFKTYGFSTEQSEKILKSQITEDFFDLYMKDVKSELLEENTDKENFNSNGVKAVMVNNLDFLVNLTVGEDATDEEGIKVEREIIHSIKNETDNFIKCIPSVKNTVKAINKAGYGGFFKIVLNPLTEKILIISILILCVLIFVLRSYKCWGLIWLGTSFLISSVALAVITALSAVYIGEYMFASFVSKSLFVYSVGQIFVWEFIFITLITIIISVLFYVVYGKIKKTFFNK